ncbi:MAG: hypothetical protein UY07_C0002G0030 [Parcubacteria group bacterium GW2011_GWA1_47_8]|nr:MAG: hypothetical protein UY07_C0002G0030 [Parcubacteria group bacterium GW2011_GWA1_47_8]
MTFTKQKNTEKHAAHITTLTERRYKALEYYKKDLSQSAIAEKLGAHRSKMVAVYLLKQKSWLKTVRYPAYAPNLNPIEYVWGAIKKKDIEGIAGDWGLSYVMKQVQKGKKRIQKDQEILIY